MSRMRTSVWRRCAAAAVALSAACVPNEDLSSYGSSASEGATPGSVRPSGSSSVSTARPSLPAAGEDAAGLETGAPAALEGEAALLGGDDRDPPPPSSALPDAATPDAGPPPPPFPGALVGSSRHTLDVGGVARSFLYHAPPALDPNVPAPVLIVAHGFEESAAEIAAITGYDSIAEREGFVVLYPEGQGVVPWNIGSGVCQGGARTVGSASGDDSAFIDAMLSFVALDRAVDEAHVFMSGLASGGYLVNDLGCRRSDIRAIVAHSGGSHALDACVAAHKPVLLLHGSEDAAVPLTCSVEARDRWAAHNGCAASSDPPEQRAVLGGVCEESVGCPANGQVSLCTFEGMGRGWAGGAAQDASFLDFESASELSWLFFTTFAW